MASHLLPFCANNYCAFRTQKILHTLLYLLCLLVNY
nr:MAG TPA: hypothetical protein [Bacteriophage sp.]